MDNSRQIPTILIVEDIQWIRSAMRKAVERQGYSVLEARNYAEVFPFADSQSIDLILTEEELPTFNELMVLLNQHPTLRRVPVVIVNPMPKMVPALATRTCSPTTPTFRPFSLSCFAEF